MLRLYTVRVLEDRCLYREQGTHGGFCFAITIYSEGLHRVEGSANPFPISVTVLHNDAFDCLRMLEGDAIANGGAIVLLNFFKPRTTSNNSSV